jgi:tetratricopeptide (TPR) repeat protein
MPANDISGKSGNVKNKPTTAKNETPSRGGAQPPEQLDANKYRFIVFWVVIGIVSLLWWCLEGRWCLRRIVLIGGLSLAAFTVGNLIGFLFSSHGEETDTIGKIRDWVIGGITTLTIAKAGAIKGTITTFAAGVGPNEFAVAFGAAVAYAALGFFFMYFWRELYFNIDLTRSRNERGALEDSKQAAEQVVKAFQVKLPADILTGGHDVSDITNDQKKQAAKDLEDQLSSPDVETFLDEVNKALQDGTNLDWDTVSKVAYIQYYRTYFAKEEDKIAQARCALDWIRRALLLNPHHADLTTKCADMLAAVGDFQGAVNILEGMVHQPDAPLMVRQWMGYLLLFVPHRAADSIRYSNDYLQLVGQDTDSLFNIACAYAQAFCEGPGAEPNLENLQVNHDKALEYLRIALQREPDYASVVLSKWTNKGESFECFAKDPKFLDLVAPKNPGTPGAPPAASASDTSIPAASAAIDVSTSKDIPIDPPMVVQTKPADPNAGAASDASPASTSQKPEKT